MSLVKTWKKVQSSVVAIAKKSADTGPTKFIAFGSGVCVHPSGVIVTAKHVVVNEVLRSGLKIDIDGGNSGNLPENFYVIFVEEFGDRPGAKAITARPKFAVMHEELDIAFLILHPGDTYKFMKLAHYNGLSEGQAIASAGFPLMSNLYARLKPNLFQGIISMMATQEQIICDISLHRGNSGGPVFTSDTGKLVGIAVEYRTSSKTEMFDGKEFTIHSPTNITHVISCNVVHGILNSIIKTNNLSPLQ